jgi:hypothetical protein
VDDKSTMPELERLADHIAKLPKHVSFYLFSVHRILQEIVHQLHCKTAQACEFLSLCWLPGKTRMKHKR